MDKIGKLEKNKTKKKVDYWPLERFSRLSKESFLWHHSKEPFVFYLNIVVIDHMLQMQQIEIENAGVFF